MYHITSEGRVFSWRKGKFLKYRFLNQKETKDGNKKYYVRYLLKNATTGQKDEMLAHVLVWKLFGDFLETILFLKMALFTISVETAWIIGSSIYRH